MDIKMVFFDVDGTLLDSSLKIPESTKEAISKLKKNKIDVVISTGRSPVMFMDILNELNVDSYVSCNGSYVSYKNEIVYKKTLDSSALSTLQEEAAHRGHPMVLGNQEYLWTEHKYNTYVKECMAYMGLGYPKGNNAKPEDVYYSFLCCGPESEDLYINNYDQFRFVRWHPNAIDVIPAGGSKALGIKRMIQKLGVDKSSIMVIGDGNNDMEMIKYAGTGVAMGNAVPKTKAVADYVTDHVDNDGVYNALEKFQLI